MNAFTRVVAELLRQLAEALVGLGRGLVIFPTSLANVLAPLVGGSLTAQRPRPQGDFERRIEEITERLNQSGSDAQELLNELEQVMESRREQVVEAHGRLLALQLEESEIEERVAALRSVRPEAAGAISDLLSESLEERDKRSARRDWLIFGMGALLSVVVSLAFFLLTGVTWRRRP